jgi:hypothetical protein
MRVAVPAAHPASSTAPVAGGRIPKQKAHVCHLAEDAEKRVAISMCFCNYSRGYDGWGSGNYEMRERREKGSLAMV